MNHKKGKWVCNRVARAALQVDIIFPDLWKQAKKFIVQNRWHVMTSLFLLCIYLEWHRNNWRLKSRTRTSLSQLFFFFPQNFTLYSLEYLRYNPSPLPNRLKSLCTFSNMKIPPLGHTISATLEASQPHFTNSVEALWSQTVSFDGQLLSGQQWVDTVTVYRWVVSF